MEPRRRTLAVPTPPTGSGGAATTAPVVAGGGGAIGGATGASEPDVLAARLAAVETKLDALLGAVTGLRMGSLELLTLREVCGVLKLSRTKVNELVQGGALGMWKLDGERRITRAGLDAYIRRQASGTTDPSTLRLGSAQAGSGQADRRRATRAVGAKTTARAGRA